MEALVFRRRSSHLLHIAFSYIDARDLSSSCSRRSKTVDRLPVCTAAVLFATYSLQNPHRGLAATVVMRLLDPLHDPYPKLYSGTRCDYHSVATE